MNEVLRAERISKSFYSGKKKIEILRSIHFQAHKNELTAIIGKSGSGKTSLLRILSGLDAPDEGSVFFGERNLHGLSGDERSELRRRDIGFVFQDFSLIPELTVLENIKLPCYFDHKEPISEHLEQLIDLLELRLHLNKFPDEISGGEKQRTAIARALVNQPALVFADEPTGNLDNQTSRQVLEMFLLSKKRLSQTMILVTHDLDLARYADTVYLLKDGQLSLWGGRAHG